MRECNAARDARKRAVDHQKALEQQLAEAIALRDGGAVHVQQGGAERQAVHRALATVHVDDRQLAVRRAVELAVIGLDVVQLHGLQFGQLLVDGHHRARVALRPVVEVFFQRLARQRGRLVAIGLDADDAIVGEALRHVAEEPDRLQHGVGHQRLEHVAGY